MNRFLAPLVLAISLTLAGCGGNIGKVISAATTTVKNPVSTTDIYRAKNVYAASLELAVKYRQYCWGKPYRAILADSVAKPVCQHRRAVVRKIQSADAKAYSAITRADSFVRNNPTLNAATVISEAWDAVRAFQNAIPRVN